MELEVYWTRFAENKLSEIYQYYSVKASKEIALNLIDGIVDLTIDLNKNPEIGQLEILLSERTEDFRYLIYKNYKIIYWINKTKHRIDISNVFDCRQNPNKIKV